jgi:hypothetical protein
MLLAGPAIADTDGNTQEGDCVIASKLHILGSWTGNELGTPLRCTDAEALTIYHQLCGGGDNGCVITDVLDQMKAGAFVVGGQPHKIDGYCAVNLADQNEVKVCTEVFGGGISLGLNLPGSWANSVQGNGFIWDNATDGSVGGHDVPIIDYNAQGVQIATWGYWGTITWAALANAAICEEAWQMLGPDWYNHANLAPNGISADTLRADLALLTGGQTPPLPGPAPVPPGPTPIPTPSGNVLQLATDLSAGTYPVGVSGISPDRILQVISELQALLPTEHARRTIVLPPWLLTFLELACAEGVTIPGPVGVIVQLLCGLLPKSKKKCGCK